MTLGRRQIDVADNDIVRFQMTSSGADPAVVWLYMAAAGGFSVTYVSYEALRGSGPFRLELHKGRVDASPGMSNAPDCRTLHTTFFGDYGEWDSTLKWLQGAGVHAQDSALTDSNGGDYDYFTFLLFPLSKKNAGAGIRCKVDDGLNGT